MNPSAYVLTASQLKAFNEKAYEEGQNRILTIKDKYSSKPDEEELDETMMAIIRPQFHHTNHAGAQSWRCSVTYGVKNNSEPRTAFLDVSLTLLDEMKKHTLRDELKKKLRESIKSKKGFSLGG